MELHRFQVLIRHEILERVLDTSLMTDAAALSLVDALLRKRVFDVATNGDGGLEGAFMHRKPLA